MIDALAYEPQFLDHLAPVWNAMPASLRGRFITDPDLLPRAQRYGIAALGLPAPRPVPANPAPSFVGNLALVASWGDIKRGRRMGYGPFAYLEHGIGQSYTGDRATARHSSYSGGEGRQDVTLNLVPNEHAARQWRTHYPDAAVEIIGSPKLDSLPAREPGPGPVIALSFHFPCSVCAETQPAFGHFYPALETLRNTYTVIGHGHPRFYGIERKYRRLRIEHVPDFADVCRRADLYICDNSSTIFEFASTGRPVVVLNSPTYRRDIRHGLRFWDAADVGVQVDDWHDLLPAVERALADPPEQQAKREAALRIVYAHRTGASERAAEALMAWADAREAVAA